MKNKTVKQKHCRFCKEGRVIETRSKELTFCSLCGKEFRVRQGY